MERQRSFRLVCEPDETEAVQGLLADEGFGFEPEPFSPWCRRLLAEPFALGESLAARFGLIYIQDRSSMLPPLALAAPRGAGVLDLCSAPGSKTGFLSQLVGGRGFVLANEPSRDRLETLRANLRRLNRFNTATTSSPGERLDLAEGSFGHLLLDPPCSGWGTAEKNPQVRTLWSEDKTGPLVALQRKLLSRAAELLAPGGRLVYSTCTTNTAENEDQALWAAEELGLLPSPLDAPEGFVLETPERGLRGVWRVDQARSNGQGFFVAAFTKPGEGPPPAHPDAGANRLPGRVVDPASLSLPKGAPLDFSLLPPGEVRDFSGRLFFLPAAALSLSGVRWQGVLLGRASGANFRPWPGLRRLMHPFAPGAGLNADDPAELRALLTGRSLDVAGTGRGLYYRGLPLALAARKGRRLLFSDR